jgi:hypothetical protein
MKDEEKAFKQLKHFFHPSSLRPSSLLSYHYISYGHEKRGVA